MKPDEKVVLCLNDSPIGVYDSKAEADKAAEADWRAREPRWREQGLTSVGSAFQASFGGVYLRYHYHQHAFVVNAPAKL
jgi:hypothetical protein